MKAHRSSAFRLKTAVTLISLTGLLCLTLVDMLPRTVFILAAVIHLIVHRNFYGKTALPAALFTWVALSIFLIGIVRIHLSGNQAAVPALRDMIVSLAIVRLILQKTAREIHQIIGLALTECILSTIFTVSPVFLAGLALMAFLIPFALYELDAASFSAEDEIPPTASHWTAVWLGITLISALMFYIIPRPSSTLINYSLIKRTTTGFTENVSLAQATSVAEDRSVAMRIVWNSGSTPDYFYLNGARLETATPDGFQRTDHPETAFIKAPDFSDHLTIYPVEIHSRNLFYPFRLSAVSPDRIARHNANLYWKGEIPPVYDVWVARKPELHADADTAVPPELRDVAELGARLASGTSPTAKAESLAAYLGRTCVYSLEKLDIPDETTPLSWFVFDGRKGSCEHFAAALAVMLRGAGIPARVAAGFLVSEFNPAGNYFIVRSSDAHAWVEYYDGYWHAIDATPRATTGPRLKSNRLDTWRFRWQRWVIEYSLQDQISFAASISLHAPQLPRKSAKVISPGILLAALVWLILTLRRRRRLNPYSKVMRAFAKKGVRLDPHSTHTAHLATVKSAWPAMAPCFERYLDIYLAGRFGGRRVDIEELTNGLILEIRHAQAKQAGRHRHDR